MVKANSGYQHKTGTTHFLDFSASSKTKSGNICQIVSHLELVFIKIKKIGEAFLVGPLQESNFMGQNAD
jgi:hypothetical protein